MAGKTNYLEDLIINCVLRGSTFPSWTTGNHYAALWIGDPTDTGSGGAEVTGGSYARVAIARASGSWDAPTDVSGSQSTQNTAAITFPAPTANWGTVTHLQIMDASTAGNALYNAALGTSRTINNGDGAPSFAIGALDIGEG